MNTEETKSIEEQYKAIVDSLLEKRKNIIKSCEEKIQQAELQRDHDILHNNESLLKIGLKENQIPNFYKSFKFKKLSDNLIQSTLSSYMKKGVYYSSTPLLKRLGIAYTDLRTFVNKNPNFIKKIGVNKGTKYIINE
jgi:hypothetical protein